MQAIWGAAIFNAGETRIEVVAASGVEINMRVPRCDDLDPRTFTTSEARLERRSAHDHWGSFPEPCCQGVPTRKNEKREERGENRRKEERSSSNRKRETASKREREGGREGERERERETKDRKRERLHGDHHHWGSSDAPKSWQEQL